MLSAKAADLIVDLVQDSARLVQFIFVRAGKLGRIGKRPVQASHDSWEYRTFFSFGFVANRDDVGKQYPRLENVEDSARFIFGNVDSDFLQDLDRERIQFAWLETGAFPFEKVAATFVEQCRGHLAARAVVDTNEEHLLFHGRKY